MSANFGYAEVNALRSRVPGVTIGQARQSLSRASGNVEEAVRNLGGARASVNRRRDQRSASPTRTRTRNLTTPSPIYTSARQSPIQATGYRQRSPLQNVQTPSPLLPPPAVNNPAPADNPPAYSPIPMDLEMYSPISEDTFPPTPQVNIPIPPHIQALVSQNPRLLGIPEVAQALQQAVAGPSSSNNTYGTGQPQLRPDPGRIPPYPNNPVPRFSEIRVSQPQPPQGSQPPQVSQPPGGGEPPQPHFSERSVASEMLAWPEFWEPGTCPEDKDVKEGVFNYDHGFWSKIEPLDNEGKAHYQGIGKRRNSLPRIYKSDAIIAGARNPAASQSSDWEEYYDTGFNRADWLASEPSWKEGIAGPNTDSPNESDHWQNKRWRGTKYLGNGANGIIGLWEREEGGLPNSPETSKIPGEVHKVVVKQQKFDEDFEQEVRLFTILGRTGSKHLVRMYKYALSEMGYDHSTVLKGDGRGFNVRVGRMFMELCDGGNMENYILKEVYIPHTAASPFPERLIWKIFRCLALSILALEFGTENLQPAIRVWNRRCNLIHFDIKPDNIFIKLNDPDPEHRETPLFKLADYGCMQNAPQRELQRATKTWARETKWLTRFSTHHATPEQAHKGYLPERYYGSPLNVCQIGRLIAEVMLRGRDTWMGTGTRPYFNFRPDARYDKVIRTMGTDLLDAPYSVSLRSLVLRCLAYDWQHRPSTRQLLATIDRAIPVADAAQEEADRWGELFESQLRPVPMEMEVNKRDGQDTEMGGTGQEEANARERARQRELEIETEHQEDERVQDAIAVQQEAYYLSPQDE